MAKKTSNTVYLTQEGLEELKAELDNLINVRRPENIISIKEARSLGDLSENADYDAFCVFDADNIAHIDFIKNMNKKLCQGEDVVQGYRDIKNPTDSWITAGYAIFYWTMHRFYHLARYNLGLSPLLNGTGFMVRFDVIKPEGGLKTWPGSGGRRLPFCPPNPGRKRTGS